MLCLALLADVPIVESGSVSTSPVYAYLIRLPHYIAKLSRRHLNRGFPHVINPPYRVQGDWRYQMKALVVHVNRADVSYTVIVPRSIPSPRKERPQKRPTRRQFKCCALLASRRRSWRNSIRKGGMQNSGLNISWTAPWRVLQKYEYRVSQRRSFGAYFAKLQNKRV